ncbi:hypothetical protein BH20ACI3_BH20ACI3_43120 [soil metagenome]
MKLRPLAIVLFLFSPVTAANCSRRHRRTLSATTKKPASMAGFLYLRLSLTRLTALLLPPAPLPPTPRSIQLTIQTPSSLQPGLVQHRIVCRLVEPAQH